MLKIFTVYDEKAESFINPFYAPTEGVAIRNFESAANDTQHDFNRYAADYTLFCIGEFHPEDGSIEMYETKRSLGSALEYIEATRPALQEVQ